MASIRSISYHGQYTVNKEIGIFTEELKEAGVNKAPIVPPLISPYRLDNTKQRG